jgi:hypothetical protein
MRKTFTIALTLDSIYGNDGVNGFNDEVIDLLNDIGALEEGEYLSGLAYTPLSVIGDLVEIEVTADSEIQSDDESND